MPVELAPTEDGLRRGRLALTVENTGESELTLRLLYLPGDGRNPVEVSKTETGGVTLLHPEADELSVGADEVERLTVEFSQKADALPSALDGQLVIRAEAADQAGAGADPDAQDQQEQEDKITNLVIDVSGVPAPIEGVAFEPATLTLQATEWLGPTVASGTHAEVILRGSGVPAFVAAQELAQAQDQDGDSGPVSDRIGVIADDWNHVEAPVTLLANANGDQVVVELSDVELRGPDWASGTVEISSAVHAGEYSGKLTLSPLLSDPALTLTVRSRHAFPWLVLTVLVGALLGGLLPLLSGIWTRRRLLWAELDGIAKQYFDEVDRLRKGRDASDPLPLWDLRRDVGVARPPYGDDWWAIPKVEGARGIHSEIRWARSADELEDVGKQVGALAEKVGPWLMVAPEVRALRDALEGEVKPRPGRSLANTKIYTETDSLIEDKTKPADDAAVEALVVRIDRQRRWLERVFGLNNEIAIAQADEKNFDDNQRQALAGLDLKALADPPSAPADRTDQQWLDLFIEAARIERRVAEIKSGQVEPPEVVDGAPVDQLDQENAAAALEEDKKARADAVEGARDRAKPAKRTSWPDVFAAVTRQQIAVTLTAVVGAALVYAIDPYSSTWGSLKDYGAAFAAGFGAQIAFEWVAQPIFSRWRVRKDPAGEDNGSPKAPKPGAGDAGDQDEPTGPPPADPDDKTEIQEKVGDKEKDSPNADENGEDTSPEN